MRQRNIDRRTRRRAFGHRGDPGLAAAGRRTHDVAENRREHRVAVLLLAIDADHRGLAVAHRRIALQQTHRNLADLATDRLARSRQGGQILLEATGKRIADDRDRRGLAQAGRHRPPRIDADLFEERQYAPDLHHRPSEVPSDIAWYIT